MKPVDACRFTPRVEALEGRWLPSNYRLSPVVPNIDTVEAAHLAQVIQLGQQRGNLLNVFARAGDSITADRQFLVPLATPSIGADLAGDGSLNDTLNFFRSGIIGAQNSFSRTTTAAGLGWTSADVLASLPGELALTRASFVLIMVGTNDLIAGVPVDVFQQRLTAIAQTALNMGVVPVLSTIPDNLLAASFQERLPSFNQAIEDVAAALNVPVWNYWRALQKLPAFGLSAGGVHPSVSPTGGSDLTDTGLHFGYNVRNLTALQTLDKLKRILLQGAPPDLPNDAVGWAPLTHAIPVATGDTIGFQVRVLDAADRRTLFSFDPFPGYTGSVHVTTGDINGDGTPDLIATVGPGGPPHVKAFDGLTGSLIASFYAFDAGFRSGLNVTTADVNRDGRDDIIVCPETNGPAHVKVFTAESQPLASFYAFAPTFLGGAKVAAADVNRDGYAEIMVAAGRGGEGHVIVFDGLTLGVISSFFPFGAGYASDVSLAAGDFNGDGSAELAVGAGTGVPPTVTVFDPLNASVLASFLAYAPGYTGGVKLTTVDRGKGRSELVTASHSALTDMRIYNGFTAEPLDGFLLDEAGFRYGVSFGS